MVSQVARYGTRNSASARSSCGTWSAQGKSPSSDEATQIRAISPAARSKTQAEIRMAKVHRPLQEQHRQQQRKQDELQYNVSHKAPPHFSPDILDGGGDGHAVQKSKAVKQRLIFVLPNPAGGFHTPG